MSDIEISGIGGEGEYTVAGCVDNHGVPTLRIDAETQPPDRRLQKAYFVPHWGGWSRKYLQTWANAPDIIITAAPIFLEVG